MRCLLIIDMQDEFLNEHTEKVFDNIMELVLNEDYNYTLATEYKNHKESACYRMLNWKERCELESSLDRRIESWADFIVSRNTYSKCDNGLLALLRTHKISNVDIVGVNTDACVLATAFSLFEAKQEFRVISDLCASTEGEDIHNAALLVMKSALGVNRIISRNEMDS